MGAPGSGGHNVKPISEKKKDGTHRKDRDSLRLENFVKPLTRIPIPPSYFDATHVGKWNEICQQIIDLGILTRQDTDAVESYVKNWVISRSAWEDVCENGQTLWVTTTTGSQKPVTNPSLAQFHEAEANMKRLQLEFGLTPRARMSLKVEKKEEKGDPFEQFLN